VFDRFTSASIEVEETEIFVRYAGRGPAILLLHGLPQTHVMWRHVAPALAADFSVVCADLRGYGASGKPSSAPDHAPYTKRAMARDMVQMMRIIGLGNWGSDPNAFPAHVREQYVNALRSPEAVHAICEEYRAAATLDRAHDEADRRAARVIECPVLALWSEGGSLDAWYQDVGGPLGILHQWAPSVRGRPVRGGHFFPEQNAGETVTALREFMLG
jgi:pimeloyl-ACP methyl ester carboxylesterase